MARRGEGARGISLGEDPWNLVPLWWDLSAWTASGTPQPVRATDPAGGDTAWTLTDDDSVGGAEHVISPGFDAAPLRPYVASVYVLKDAVTTRVPAMLFGKTGSFGIVKLNTSTGDTQNPVIAGLTNVSFGALDRGGWWQLWLAGTTADVTASNYGVRLYPAYDTDLVDTANVAALGSATFWRPTVEVGSTPTP